MEIFSPKKMGSKVGSYTLCNSIGSGIFGEVFKATAPNSSGWVAVKRMDKLSSKYNKKRVQAEIKAAKSLHHENVVSMIHHFEKLRHSYLVLEFVEGPSLIELMEERDFEPLEELVAKDIFRQLIQAVSYCHSKGVAHRDIKLDNILLDKTGTIKLIDFGLCELEAQKSLCRDAVGSMEYCAPEVLQGKPHSALLADTWSCGGILLPYLSHALHAVVLFALLFGEFPYSEEDRRKQQCGILVPLIFHNQDFVQLSPEAYDLVRKMLTPSEHRPSMEDVSCHRWLLS